MLAFLFYKVLKLMITSIICSLSIYLGYLISITDNGILFFSFTAFVIATGIDAFRFSFDFWKIKDYYIGLFLPLVLYSGMGFFTCMFFKPIVFNRIFLPLRFAGCFGIKTIESIVIVSIAVIVIITILRFFRARSGRLFYSMYLKENEDM